MGGGAVGAVRAGHGTPRACLSLDNAFDDEELDAWHARVRQGARARAALRVRAEDRRRVGGACVYEKGRYVAARRAATAPWART